MTIQPVSFTHEISFGERRKDCGTTPLFGVIDSRHLFGESLVHGLQDRDKTARYQRFASFDEWLDSDDVAASLVLLHVSHLDKDAEAELAQTLKRLILGAASPAFLILADDEDAQYILHWLKIGVRGYIPTSLALPVVVQALHLVLAGGVFLPATVIGQLAQNPSGPSAASQSLLCMLSPKEVLVAKELRRGIPNKIIAYNLNMCESTVKVHVRSIMKKLSAKNRTEVAYISTRVLETPESV